MRAISSLEQIDSELIIIQIQHPRTDLSVAKTVDELANTQSVRFRANQKGVRMSKFTLFQIITIIYHSMQRP